MIALNLFPSIRHFLLLMGLFLGIGGGVFSQYSRISLLSYSVEIYDIPGEAIFVRLPGGYSVLIDGGLNTQVVEKLSEKLHFWEKNIDAVVVSHPDKDHLEGIIALLDRFSVGTLFVSGVHHGSHLFQYFQQLVSQKNVRVVFGNSKTDFRLSNTVFDIVFPTSSELGKEVKKVNNSSLVLRSRIKSNTFLFTGDIEKTSEKILLKNSARISSDILKVAHHGSKTSSRSDFLQAVSPREAVISAHKDNIFGHPHSETLKRFSTLSIPIRTTATEGDIYYTY